MNSPTESTPAQHANLMRDLRELPNMISLARIAILILCLACWFVGWHAATLILGTIAGLTDYLDGYLARRLNKVTYLGAILDQFSDLLFETCLLIMVATSDAPYGVPMWLIVVYLLREFWVMTIRRFLAAHQVQIHSNIFGKLKTNFISWSFIAWYAYIMRLAPAADVPFLVIGWIGVGGGVAFSLWSAFDYSRQFFKAYDTLRIDHS